jgi:hypothetical protein
VSRPEAAEEDPVLTLEQALDGREGKASALHADERRMSSIWLTLL